MLLVLAVLVLCVSISMSVLAVAAEPPRQQVHTTTKTIHHKFHQVNNSTFKVLVLLFFFLNSFSLILKFECVRQQDAVIFFKGEKKCLDL